MQIKNILLTLCRAAVLTMIFCSLSLAPAALASEDLREVKLPENLFPGLNYLRDFTDPGYRQAFVPDRVAEILAFVRKAKKPSEIYYADQWFDADSAYCEYDIRGNLDQILKLSHNPDIPSFMLMPSSVRLAYWAEFDGRKQPSPQLWKMIPAPGQVTVLRGVEHIVNTPDIFSGAYYAYDLNRCMILFKHHGRNIFISISKQADISDVGRKGLVLGSDDDWNYLYSSEKGLTKSGLGWVSSYMYDSFSVTVYDEIDPGRPLVRCGIFKWVRAGWAKINVVNKRHIYSGLERYVKTFREIFEHTFLPDPKRLERLFAPIESLSEHELRPQVQAYFKALKDHYGTSENIPRQWFDEILQNDDYVARLTDAEMKSILVLQELKKILRKNLVALAPEKPR